MNQCIIVTTPRQRSSDKKCSISIKNYCQKKSNHFFFHLIVFFFSSLFVFFFRYFFIFINFGGFFFSNFLFVCHSSQLQLHFFGRVGEGLCLTGPLNTIRIKIPYVVLCILCITKKKKEKTKKIKNVKIFKKKKVKLVYLFIPLLYYFPKCICAHA